MQESAIPDVLSYFHNRALICQYSWNTIEIERRRKRTELVQRSAHIGAIRATSHIIEKVWLYRSPILVGREESSTRSWWLLPDFSAARGGGGGSTAPCGKYHAVTIYPAQLYEMMDASWPTCTWTAGPVHKFQLPHLSGSRSYPRPARQKSIRACNLVPLFTSFLSLLSLTQSSV